MQHSKEMRNDDASQGIAWMPWQSVVIVAVSGIVGWYLVYKGITWALGLF